MQRPGPCSTLPGAWGRVMADELLAYARDLVQRDENQDERARRDAQFRRDLQELPLDLQLHLLRMMVRRVFGPTEDGGA